VDTSSLANLCHPERTILTGGEFVQAFSGKYVPEHQIAHLELPTMHKPLLIAPKRLVVPCILESCLLSCFVDQVNINALELVLCGFIVCLNMGGDHGDFLEDNSFSPIHQEERRLPRSPA
jgi:hypothetical protein